MDRSPRYYNRKKKKIMQMIICFALVLIASAAFLTVRAMSPLPIDSSSSEAESGLPPSSETELEPSEPSSAVSQEEPSSAAPESSASPSSDAPVTYQPGEPVPKTKAVDRSYLDDAVFIGDSRTEGFSMYNSIPKASSLTYKGLKVDTAFTEPCINIGDQKLTVMDALAQKSFSKVYIMLGVNELGWIYSDVFISDYGKIIDRILELNPKATVYIQSILPVSAKKSANDSIYNNPKINEYNNLLQKLAKDKNVYYLNVAEAVAGPDGALPEDTAFDGVHLKREGCEQWLQYLLEHAVG